MARRCPRPLLPLCLLLATLLCTGWEHIVSVSIGSSRYHAYVGFDMISKGLGSAPGDTVEESAVRGPARAPASTGNTTVRADCDDGGQVQKSETKVVKTKPKKSTSSSKSSTPRNQTSASPVPNLWSSLFSGLSLLADPLPPPPPLPECPTIPPGLLGRAAPVLAVPALGRVATLLPGVARGGESRPAGCTARHQVAVVVPYRDRPTQLAVFLRNLHPMLRRQQLHYRIYLVNQTDENAFNRAMLMNVGFQEAMRDRNWTCAVFHDVDLLPEDDRNIYSCPEQPRHLSVAVDKFKYQLPYKGIFGGATVVRADQFRKLNGYSNMFWGWGGEDDDMSKRINHHRLKIIRYQADIGRYTMIKHKQEKANKLRQSLLSKTDKRYNTDGLNSLSYSVVAKRLHQLFTVLDVALDRSAGSIKSEKEAEKKGFRKVGPRQWAVRVHHPR